MSTADLRLEAERIIREHLNVPKPDPAAATALLQAEVENAWRAANQRKKRVPSWKKLREWEGYGPLFDKAHAEYRIVFETYHKSKDSMEREVAALVEQGLVPEPGDHRAYSAFVYPGTYLSPGLAADRYAAHATQMARDHVEYYGLRSDTDGWSVYAYVKDPDVDHIILSKCPGPPLVDVVQKCWAVGVNPRVYMPFLPHNFELMAGLDYFGCKRATHPT